ncbi:osteocalcin [Macrotis lagotis]|uniref:osteocalcin n=1 Tax=Macrotis lagotis TaxID=92651 RepID=UPI003D68B8F0
MKIVLLLSLLTLATLCLCKQDAQAGPQDSGKRTAFASKRESSELVRRPKRYLNNWQGLPAPYPDPLEQKREVCELNPDCDELADHIGFSEAYRRFYGTA